MYFNTGKKMVRKNYTRLSMPNSIIKKVEELTDRDRVEKGLNFKNRQKEIFSWDNEITAVIKMNKNKKCCLIKI